ncbi:ribulose-5-phosphate 4-epimerase/fuculose-1-phosphate aldolase [Spinactinospora alkalitolerans]|uniref:Ribulose-5-phosphate 4-epimerase/fuculose-1-phosphate aldolase n=1 Tax=Spinactinospora alkalitolerans TaxID=687207 RepID=A0A852TNC3_9ACTN|nr:class II aldolase/adducin family protein [Spinactinospora alkalitolerans]NYE45438.1 ribulose-5-phosphate 4-epimerase/fuculose-1-phosphate aldolase [Spinactinospora alkalitolerans]
MASSDTLYSQDESIANVLHELARAHRILEMEGHGDMSMGHLSYRDPHGRGLWLKQGNLGLEEVTGRDFILIDFDGNVLEGQGLRHLEWPLHTEIMLARPEVNVVGHSHPFHSTVFSATTAEIAPYVNHAVWFADHGVPRFTETSHIITTQPLGASVAQTLGEAEAVLLANHGVAFVGRNVKEAALSGIFLEKAAKAQLALAASGLAHDPPGAAETIEKHRVIYPERARSNYWMYFNRKLSALEEREAREFRD